MLADDDAEIKMKFIENNISYSILKAINFYFQSIKWIQK